MFREFDMTAAEKAREVLYLSALSLPPKPKVLGIDVEDYVDTTGDDSLRVQILLDESTTDEELGEDTFRLKWAVFERLRSAGIEEYPYILVAKPSELAEAEDE
jgi:hypothetical protein